MSKKEQSINISFQFKAIEILSSRITQVLEPIISNESYNFNIQINYKVNKDNFLVIVLVSIEITTIDQQNILGAITISCAFSIANFTELIIETTENAFEINDKLIEILNSISISTTRGVMFGHFKGTFLHNAILPIVDPKSFVSNK